MMADKQHKLNCIQGRIERERGYVRRVKPVGGDWLAHAEAYTGLGLAYRDKAELTNLTPAEKAELDDVRTKYDATIEKHAPYDKKSRKW